MNRETSAAVRLDRILELVRRAATAPSDRILTGYRNPALAVEQKPDSSPVTAFDQEAEQHIRQILQSDPEIQWPVLGEEFGGDTAGSPYRWVVDPIDGTLPFSRGLPYFGTLVAFEEVREGAAAASTANVVAGNIGVGSASNAGAGNAGAGGASNAGAGSFGAGSAFNAGAGSVVAGSASSAGAGVKGVGTYRALAGAINLPPFGELYSAARGMGAHCNSSAIHVAARRELKDCVIAAPEIQKFRVAGLEEGYERLAGVARYFRGNGDCWMHAMAARGAFDAVVEFSLNRWDIAATEVIVEEAGGRFYTRPSKTVQGKYDLVCGSPGAADRIVELLDFRPG